MWYRVLVFTPRVTEGSAYDPPPSAFPTLLSLILKSFRFEDEGDSSSETQGQIVEARRKFKQAGKYGTK